MSPAAASSTSPQGVGGATGTAARLLAQQWQAAPRRRRLFDTDDRDCAREVVSRVFRPHQLMPRGTAPLRARMDQLGTCLLGVSALEYGATVDILPGPLERFYLLQIPIAGQAHIRAAGRDFVSDVGCASLISPAPDLQMQWQAGNLQLCVRVDATLLTRALAAWSGAAQVPTPTFEPQVQLCRQPLLLDTLLTLIDVAGRHPLEEGALATVQLQHRLISMLLGTLAHDGAAHLAGRTPPITPRNVRQVEDYLIAHCDQPLTPELLAAQVGVSVRALFLGFQRYRQVSPIKLLREVRLKRARDDLLHAAPGTRVTDVALRWGMTHLGRFSREYFEAFGESPSQTLRATQR